MNNKELKVAALQNGTVIDHLPTDQVFRVLSLLHLDTYKGQITIGNNLDSKRMGAKGIIKISDKFLDEDEANKIALIAPNAKINIIRNYEVVEKYNITLPHEVHGIVRCLNPKCVTNNQPIETRFDVHNENNETSLHCHYCEREVKQKDIVLI